MPEDKTQRIVLEVVSPAAQSFAGLEGAIKKLESVQRAITDTSRKYAVMMQMFGAPVGKVGGGMSGAINTEASAIRAATDAVNKELVRFQTSKSRFGTLLNETLYDPNSKDKYVKRTYRDMDSSGRPIIRTTKSTFSGIHENDPEELSQRILYSKSANRSAQEQARRDIEARRLREQRAQDRFSRDVYGPGGFASAVSANRDFQKYISGSSKADAASQAAMAREAEEKRLAGIEQAKRNIRARAILRYRSESREQAKVDADVEQASRNNRARALWRKHDEQWDAQRDGNRFVGRNLISNLTHVTSWAASVGVLYGSLRLAKNAMDSMIERQYQIARLTQVYRGQRTEVRALADDILRLAAANGRSSGEAMESSIQWARLGLNRLQVTEAVRVSLMAANVAEISAADATEHLSALMAIYGIRAGELNSVLGMLNATSNTYNVTNKDLFDGLSRSAAIAKQAGLSLAELQGMIGAGVGATGQSGANIGNSIKSMLGAIASPDKAKVLRDAFQFETTDKNGGVRNMSELLAELYVKYERMSQAERTSMLYSVAGKNQVSRMTALLDNYVRSQLLAINAQWNLNSAEQENAQILSTLKAQLQGLVTEWDRFVNLQGNSKLGPANMLTQMTVGMQNLLRLANQFPNVTSMIGAGMTAIAARMFIGGASMDWGKRKTGFIGNTGKALGQAYSDVGQVAMNIAANGGWISGRLFKDIGMMNPFGSGVSRPWKAERDENGTITRVTNGVKDMGKGAIAARVAMAAIADVAIPLIAVSVAIWGINKALEAVGVTSNGANEALTKLEEQSQKARGQAEGASMAARLMSTTQRAMMGAGTTEGRISMAGQTLEAARPWLIGGARTKALDSLRAEVSELIKANRIEEANAILERERAGLLEWGAKKRSEEYQLLQRQNAVDLAEIEKQKRNPFGGKEEIARREEAVRSRNLQQAKMVGEDIDNNDEILRQVRETSAEYKAFGEIQKTIVGGIEDIYKALPAKSNLDKLDAELLMQQNIRDVLKEQYDILTQKRVQEGAAQGSTGAELNARKAQLDSEIGAEQTRISLIGKNAASKVSSYTGNYIPKNAAAEMAAAQAALAPKIQELSSVNEQIGKLGASQSNQLLEAQQEDARKALSQADTTLLGLISKRTAAEKIDEMNRTFALAQSQSRSMGIGFTEGEQFYSRMRGLGASVASNRQGDFITASNRESVEQSRIIALSHSVELADSYNEAQRRAIELQGEEKNAIIEKNREFQRGLLTSGPGELLRKMGANQLMRGGMSSGAFFSLGEGARGDIMSMGDYSPDVQRIRESRRWYEKWMQDNPQTSQSRDQAFKDRQALRAVFANINSEEIMEPARLAANKLENIVGVVNQALVAFQQRLDSTLPNNAGPGPFAVAPHVTLAQAQH